MNSSFDVDDHCPYNLIVCGIAGKAEQIENIHGFFNNVCSVLITFVLLMLFKSVEFNFRTNLMNRNYFI